MKKPISATIDVSLIEWLDSFLKENSAYRNKSHIIELAIEKFKETNPIKNNSNNKKIKK
ncbi:MAG: hypothetical protein ACMXYG_02575 [Candidatus Woesearchaeota archaeon]